MATTADLPLKAQLERASRRSRWRAFILVCPLLLFVTITFLAPISLMLFKSVEDPVISSFMPNTVHALQDWAATSLPDEAVYAALAIDLKISTKERTAGRIGTRLNYDKSGIRSVITRSARKIKRINDELPYKDQIIKIDEAWGDVEIWSVIKNASSSYTSSFYLSALDLRRDKLGDIIAQPEERQIYVQIFLRTLWVSLLITVICLFLAYPVSFLLANLPTRISNVLIILVLLPFWTSLLVRTTAWIVLLQSQGVINDIVVYLGLIPDEDRLQMIYNMTGTIVAMVHILLPFMVLPLYSVMKTIPASHMRAALSLGATPSRAFWKVYFPQTVPGIGAGSILVFILAIGYYITPALVGGRTGQLISNFIAYHMQKSLNWGLAGALGSILLIGVLILYWLYNRFIGIDKMKLG